MTDHAAASAAEVQDGPELVHIESMPRQALDDAPVRHGSSGFNENGDVSVANHEVDQVERRNRQTILADDRRTRGIWRLALSALTAACPRTPCRRKHAQGFPYW